MTQRAALAELRVLGVVPRSGPPWLNDCVDCCSGWRGSLSAYVDLGTVKREMLAGFDSFLLTLPGYSPTSATSRAILTAAWVSLRRQGCGRLIRPRRTSRTCMCERLWGKKRYELKS